MTVELLSAPWIRFARLCAALVASIATAAFVGWLTGALALAAFARSFIPMAPNTAIALLVLAASVALRTVRGRGASIASRALAIPVALLALATIGVDIVDATPLVDSLWARGAGTFHGVPLGVMSPITATGLLAASLSLFTRVPFDGSWAHRLASAAALVAGVLGFCGVLGYAYGTPLLANSTHVPIALSTSIALLAIGVGLLTTQGPRSRSLRSFVGDSVHARLMRAFVPLIGISVVLQALFTRIVLRTEAANFAVFAAITALGVIAALSAVAASVAKRIAARIDAAEADALRASKRLGALIEQLPIFVAVHRDGVLTFVNPALAEAMGAPGAGISFVGRPVQDLFHRDDREHLSLVPDDTPREVRWQTAAGATLTVLLSSRAITFDDAPAVLMVARDVSERMKLEEQLRQAVKMEAVGQLAGGIAHDFNNMLTAILSFSRFVQEDIGPTHPSQQDVREIETAAQRAAALTKQLLAFSRKSVFDPEPLDLNAVVTGMQKMIERLIGEDVSLVTVCAPSAGWVRADRGYLEQVLLNLCVNARDAMPNGGKLTVETAAVELDAEYVRGHLGAKPGRYVMLAVTDTGHGMDEATQQRIFEPFFTTKGAGRGTGLGLSTVFGIVKQAGGDIIVYSAPGQGTTFKVYLPRYEGPGATAATDTRAERRGGSESLLLVEDDPSVRAVAERTLKAAGYSVTLSPTPDEAIRVVRDAKNPIDLLVTDVVMPGMNGKDLLDAVRALRPEIRVLFMSGYTGGALVHQGIVQSGAAYLQKPFTPELLTEKVRATLDETRS